MCERDVLYGKGIVTCFTSPSTFERSCLSPVMALPRFLALSMKLLMMAYCVNCFVREIEYLREREPGAAAPRLLCQAV